MITATRSFGKTGLNTTRLGLGMAALGRPGYITLGHRHDLKENYDKEAMEAHAHAVLDAAWEAGVRYFDTARSYGLGEAFLGNWLKKKGLAKDAVMIGSKWGYTYTADWKVHAKKHEVKEHSLTVLNRQWGETQENLANYLDLYQIHSATLDSGVLENTEVLNRLAELKAQGTAIGLSLSGANQGEVLEKAMTIQIDGKPLFEAVQATYNLLERSAKPSLQAAHEAGLGVIIKEAVANGRLTQRNQSKGFLTRMAILQFLADQFAVSIDALAIAAVLAEDWVDVVLSGAAQIPHLQANLAALQVEWSDEVGKELKNIAEGPSEYWETRKALDWN